MGLYEESVFWGYRAYRHGELISEGQNPIPAQVLADATEIQWIETEPGAIAEPGDGTTD